MGLGITRIGDVTEGNCTADSHNQQSGVVISGSPNVFSNGLQTGRVTSVVKADCGEESTIISGSNIVWTNGLNTSRVTSVVGESGVDDYTGHVIGGSPTVLIG